MKNFCKSLLTCCAAMIVMPAIAGDNDTPPIADLFFGPAPFETISGSLTFSETGTVEVPFLTRKVKYARTGVLSQDTEFGHTWGAVTLPKGTKLYAMAFTDHFGVIGGFKAARERADDLPGVAWCTPYLKPEHKDMACIHARPDGTLNIVTSRGDSPYYPEYFSGNTNTLWIQPAVIEEQDVDFGVNLTIEVEVKKISKKSLKLEIFLNDGTNRSSLFWDKVARNSDGSAEFSLWGGTLRFTPTDKKSFQVEQTVPLTETVASKDEKINKPYALYTN